MKRNLLLGILLLLLLVSGCAFSTESKAQFFKKQYETKAGFSIDGTK